MKKFIVIVAALSLLACCKKRNDPALAVKKFPSGTICNPASLYSYEIVCITPQGQRFLCVSSGDEANCAQTSSTPAEAK